MNRSAPRFSKRNRYRLAAIRKARVGLILRPSGDRRADFTPGSARYQFLVAAGAAAN